jgi:hypothetical protein
MSFLPVSDAIEKEKGKGSLRPLLLSLRVNKVLDGALEPLFAKEEGRIKLLSCKERVLTLATDSPSTSQEIYLKGSALIKEINKLLGEEVFQEVKIRIRSHSKA